MMVQCCFATSELHQTLHDCVGFLLDWRSDRISRLDYEVRGRNWLVVRLLECLLFQLAFCSYCACPSSTDFDAPLLPVPVSHVVGRLPLSSFVGLDRGSLSEHSLDHPRTLNQTHR